MALRWSGCFSPDARHTQALLHREEAMVFIDAGAAVATPASNRDCRLRIFSEDCVTDDDSLSRRLRRERRSAGKDIGAVSQFDECDSGVVGVGAGRGFEIGNATDEVSGGKARCRVVFAADHGPHLIVADHARQRAAAGLSNFATSAGRAVTMDDARHANILGDGQRKIKFFKVCIRCHGT